MNDSQFMDVQGLSIIAMNVIGWMITLSGENYGPLFIFGGVAYLLTPVFMWLMLKQPYPYGDLKPSMNPDGNVALRKKTKRTK